MTLPYPTPQIVRNWQRWAYFLDLQAFSFRMDSSGRSFRYEGRCCFCGIRVPGAEETTLYAYRLCGWCWAHRFELDLFRDDPEVTEAIGEPLPIEDDDLEDDPTDADRPRAERGGGRLTRSRLPAAFHG